MKYLPSMLGYLAHRGSTKRNLYQLAKFLIVLLGLILLYSVLFHFLMAYEEKEYSWITGVYWTLTVMTIHDDATNIYLTKYLRSLRPDMQILNRSNLERNISTKVDGVMSIHSDPQGPIRENAELILLGTYEGEQKLLQWAQG